jgi:hypothetical protein
MMDSLKQAFNRFRSFFRKDQMDQKLATEVATHLDLASNRIFAEACLQRRLAGRL